MCALWVQPTATAHARLARRVALYLAVCCATVFSQSGQALAEQSELTLVQAVEEIDAPSGTLSTAKELAQETTSPTATETVTGSGISPEAMTFDSFGGMDTEGLSPEAQSFIEKANRFTASGTIEEGEYCEALDPEAAKFDSWQSLADEELSFSWDSPLWRPSTWFHKLGFRHSSTYGRNVGKGVPLQHASWSNRPYHVDWFVGTLLSDNLINNRVAQENAFLNGVRVGWDFDHYWGLEWRFGWADPDVQYATPLEESNTASYFISDVDVVYYPWGDSKIRPYALLGLGMTHVKFLDENSINQDSSLLTMPYGAGIEFPQWPWLLWRLEVLNNVSFGADNISTMSNVSFTIGMEWRIGARPPSYWPWRSSRSIW